MNLQWNTGLDLQVNSITFDETLLDGIGLTFQLTPLILNGDEIGISSGKIGYTVTVPENTCSDQLTVACVSKSSYDIPVELSMIHGNRIILQGMTLTVNVGSDENNLALFTIFGAIVLATLMIARVVTGNDRKGTRKAHKKAQKPKAKAHAKKK